MPSMTKQDLADLVREIKNFPMHAPEAEGLLLSLSDDLGYIEILARLIPENKLKELESDPNGRFW